MESKQWMFNLVAEIAIQNLQGQRKMVRRELRRNKEWRNRHPIDVECEVEHRVRANLLNILKSHLPTN